jgi:TrmH family RNA methyltransferase
MNASPDIVPPLLSSIRITLMEPKTPGNIGAVARAMKTMGLSRLVLVRPVAFREAPEALWMAHGSEDILEAAQVADTLDEALDGVAYAVGTTNRVRATWLNPIYPMDAAATEIARVAQKHTVAILFGREDRGLLNEELDRCNLITRIPAAITHPSLNLAQAVMICAYELFQAARQPPEPLSLRLAGLRDVERICRRINDNLIRIGFRPRPEPDTFLRSIRRVFRRSFRLENRDVAVLHKICDQMEEFIGKDDSPKTPP